MWENGKFVPPSPREISKNDKLLTPNERIDHLRGQFRSLIFQSAEFVRQLNNKTYESVENIENKPVVDIVLPVYGSLQVVDPCIKSVINRTKWPYKLIIVDDGSPDPLVRPYLEAVQEKYDNIQAIFQKNRGFAGAVNRGIEEGEGSYICILNSDVLVTNRWLTKLVLALEEDPKHLIVTPVTNNTALLSVDMQEGYSYIDMNRALEYISPRNYPEITPSGFCFMFRKELIEEIGPFGESFKNYGEETDFWMRSLRQVKNGNIINGKAILADDTYVFHERSTSFSQFGDDSHMDFRKKGNERFHRLNPDYPSYSQTIDNRLAVSELRSPINEEFIKNPKSWYNIAWLVHSTAPCGGMQYISNIVNELCERGVNAKVVRLMRGEDEDLSVLSELRSAPVVFRDIEHLLSQFGDKVFREGILVAATSELAQYTNEVCKRYPALQHCLHVQSYEPKLTDDPKLKEAVKSWYSLPSKVICSSKWVSEELKNLNIESPVIQPGVNTLLFHPRDRSSGDERPTFMVLLRKDYEFRGYDRGVEVAKTLHLLSKRNKFPIRILACGVERVPEVPSIVGLGSMTPSRLAQILGTEVDVFLDPSKIHSYGLPTLEALASGCSAVSWDNKGIREYGEDHVDIFPENAPPQLLAEKVFKLLQNPRPNQSPEVLERQDSVNQFIKTIEKMYAVTSKEKKITFITPHMRKYGGPSTILSTAERVKDIGHNTNLISIYDDFNVSLLRKSQIPVSLNWQNINDCDVLVVNSDNPYSSSFVKSKKARHKILYKLSHNARFKTEEEASLNQPWDAIVTSTSWLRDVCINPLKDWNHPAWPEKRVVTIGWYHYSHDLFNFPTEYKIQKDKLVISTLIHQHPLKGTKEALSIYEKLYSRYNANIHFVGIGEVPWQSPYPWIQYVYNPTREVLASIFKETDIWLGCSHTEGLGRLALENMSASAACVLSDTGAGAFQDGQNCILFPIGNEEAAYGHVECLIEDVEERRRLARGGYATASAAADPAAFMRNWGIIISRLTEND